MPFAFLSIRKACAGCDCEGIYIYIYIANDEHNLVVGDFEIITRHASRIHTAHVY